MDWITLVIGGILGAVFMFLFLFFWFSRIPKVKDKHKVTLTINKSDKKMLKKICIMGFYVKPPCKKCTFKHACKG